MDFECGCKDRIRLKCPDQIHTACLQFMVYSWCSSLVWMLESVPLLLSLSLLSNSSINSSLLYTGIIGPKRLLFTMNHSCRMSVCLLVWMLESVPLLLSLSRLTISFKNNTLLCTLYICTFSSKQCSCLLNRSVRLSA